MEPKLLVVPFPPEWGKGQATNVYLFKESRILIDAGLDSQSNRDYIKRALKEQHSWNIEKILITHGHIDHFGLSAYLQRELGAEIFIHQEDAKALEDYRSAMGWFDEIYVPAMEGGYSEGELSNARTLLFTVIDFMSKPTEFKSFKKLEIPLATKEGDASEGGNADELRDGDRGEKIESLSLPGHTPGCVGFAIGNKIFCGDVAIEGSTAVGELRKEFESLKKLEAFDRIYPGHGRTPITPKEINDLEAHFNSRLRQVLAVTKDGAQLREIVDYLYPTMEGNAGFIRRITPIRQALSYLTYLEEEGKVEKRGSCWSSSLS